MVVPGHGAGGQLSAARALEVDISSKGDFVAIQTNGLISASNDVVVQILTSVPASNVVLNADRVLVNTNTGDVDAEGSVRVQMTNITLAGPHFHFNYYAQQVDWQDFKAGESPFFVAGRSLHEEGTNHGLFSGHDNALVTTDDYSSPLQTVRASRVTVVPRPYIEGRCTGAMYRGERARVLFSRLDIIRTSPATRIISPSCRGNRGVFGPYLPVHVLTHPQQPAQRRDFTPTTGTGGVSATSPDFDLNLGRFGEAAIKYY